nr:TRBV5.3 [Sphenodon punctatus]
MDWLVVAICLLQVGCSNAEIMQQPWSLAVVEGQSADLKCTQKKGHNAMFWYRQKARRELQHLFYFNNKVELSKENVDERFTAAQPQADRSSLTISSAKPEDSAVYFCASSLTGMERAPFFWRRDSTCCPGKRRRHLTPQL